MTSVKKGLICESGQVLSALALILLRHSGRRFFSFALLFCGFAAGASFVVAHFAMSRRRAIDGGKVFGKFELELGMLWLAGKIGPLVIVVAMIVELLSAIFVADVAPAGRADGVVVLSKGGDTGAAPARSWISQQGFDRVAFKPIGFWQGGKFTESWIHAHEIDGAFADPAWPGDSWCDPNEGRTGGLLPEGKLPPVFLLA